MTNEETGEGDKNASPGGLSDTSQIDRGKLLTLLSEVLKTQHTKIISGRIRDEKTFKLRLEAVRVFAYISSVYGTILKDKDLSDIEKRLENLENANNK